ncbi:hypothetical protein LX32DRAFT_702000 [Colletotrichum zoysiae]|uniref:Uncharacterized protein n=1 Tax=Colletotrichum zoysiae TaxID=1216348 RepID=A0AAD9M1R4_9PEZI|nr:hypothetical protein LX32DRAFT_702000 [Colletotrichum zoysiae]
MAFATPCYLSPFSSSNYSCDMDLDDPVADSITFSSLSITPPQSLPTEMDVDEESYSYSSSSSRGIQKNPFSTEKSGFGHTSSSSRGIQKNPFSTEKSGFGHTSYSDGRPKNPFAGESTQKESTQKRRRSRNRKAKTDTKVQQTHRGGQNQFGHAGNQKQQLKGPGKLKPKGQQQKQQPRQPRQNRGPQRAETKQDIPVNPFLVPLPLVKGQGRRR